MIEKMTKYSFVLLSGEADSFLRKIEELGVVDITRSEKPVDEASSKLFAESEECRKAVKYLENLDHASDPDQSKFKPSRSEEVSDPLALFQEVSAKEKQLS